MVVVLLIIVTVAEGIFNRYRRPIHEQAKARMSELSGEDLEFAKSLVLSVRTYEHCLSHTFYLAIAIICLLVVSPFPNRFQAMLDYGVHLIDCAYTVSIAYQVPPGLVGLVCLMTAVGFELLLYAPAAGLAHLLLWPKRDKIKDKLRSVIDGHVLGGLDRGRDIAQELYGQDRLISRALGLSQAKSPPKNK